MIQTVSADISEILTPEQEEQLKKGHMITLTPEQKAAVDAIWAQLNAKPTIQTRDDFLDVWPYGIVQE